MVCPNYQGTEGKQVICKFRGEVLAFLRFRSSAMALTHADRYCKTNYQACVMCKELTCSKR